MNSRRLAKLGAGLIFFAVSCRAGTHDVSVSRMNVDVAVQTDGSARVSEHLTIEGEATSFQRWVPQSRHDGVSSVSVAPQEPAVIAPGPALNVTWRLPAPKTAHDLSLSYDAANIVEISGIRGLVSWTVLPAHRPWDAANVSIRVDLPEGAVLLQDPWVEEPGWTVVRLPHGMTATRPFVPAADPATVGIEFTIDKMTPTKPQWQADQEFSDEFVPAFIAAALFILITGAGILIMLRIRNPPVRVPAISAKQDGPEPDVAPALRVALMRGRPRGDRTELTAAVSSLVAQDLVDLEDDTVVIKAHAQEVWAHEAAVLAAMPQPDGTPLNLPAVFARVNRRAYRRAALDDMVHAGLADRDRVNVARDLFRSGVAIIVFGVAVWVVSALTIVQFGAWPLVVPWSILVVGLAFAAAGTRYRVLNEMGTRIRMLYFARVRDGRTTE